MVRVDLLYAGLHSRPGADHNAGPVDTGLEEDTNTLKEIVITARKREESSQNIPETVVAIGSQVLEDAHITASLVAVLRHPCC
jgi:outer membrane receptor protein involved in Fe transport